MCKKTFHFVNGGSISLNFHFIRFKLLFVSSEYNFYLKRKDCLDTRDKLSVLKLHLLKTSSYKRYCFERIYLTPIKNPVILKRIKMFWFNWNKNRNEGFLRNLIFGWLNIKVFTNKEISHNSGIFQPW